MVRIIRELLHATPFVAFDIVTRGGLCLVFSVAAVALVAARGAETNGLRITETRPGDELACTVSGEVARVVIRSGIGRATISRTGEHWPESLRLELRLKGLEGLEIVNGARKLSASIASTGDHPARLWLQTGEQGTRVEPGSPLWSEAKVVGGRREIPLAKGHFEFLIPPAFLDDNPASIRLQWIDFYR